ncbi:MAG: hypothetical protein KF901_21710 [Myxococcales bacterium]|nr:hypothetical protein [Myxococcales bacterium]
MGGANIVEADVRLGLDLVDGLTGDRLVGPSEVTNADVDTALVYRTTGSTYAIERIPAGATTFRVEAAHYVAREVVATIPAPPGVGPILTVTLLPRTGYPFPLGLTRVVGSVRYQAESMVPPILAVGAEVRVRGVYDTSSGPSSPLNGPPFDTLVTDDGQYTAWFRPLSASELPANYRPMPSACRVRIRYSTPSGIPLQQNIPPVTLALNRTTSLPTVVLT